MEEHEPGANEKMLNNCRETQDIRRTPGLRRLHERSALPAGEMRGAKVEAAK